MRKIVALLLAAVLCVAAFAGCTPATPEVEPSAPTTEPSAPVEAAPTTLTVVTSFGGDDGNRADYEAVYKGFEEATKNTIMDASETYNETAKAKIMADFETGTEPDVLYYYNGVDSNKFIEAGKVVSIDEIRAVYPDFATNMKDSMLGASPVDGKNYSVPIIGYWEAMFVNKKVLEAAGVAVPGADYTWDAFLADCEKIKTAGKTPIAVSLQEVPHYWFEYCVYNYTSVATHAQKPASSSDEIGKAWAAGLNDIKDLYAKGYLPENTLTAGDADTFQLIFDDEAAFAIDGSWKIGAFKENVADRLADFTVTYVPAKAGNRKTTDSIGGLSMGYFITKKAWDDPTKQKACVDFVTYMTSDVVIGTFNATAINALKGAAVPEEALVVLEEDAVKFVQGSTGVAPACQDLLSGTQRAELFAKVKDVANGTITAEAAIDGALAIE